MIASKYANPEIGRRNLETLVAATLEATLLHPTNAAPKAFLQRPQRSSQASMAAYRKLVYETPGFTDYFFSATPIREIAELNIGSRPASRKATPRDRGPARDSVELQLGPVPRRAAGLVRLRLGRRAFLDGDAGGTSARAAARAVASAWSSGGRSFAPLLSNLDMVLAKTDLGIAARYVRAGGRHAPGQAQSSPPSKPNGSVCTTRWRGSPASRSAWPPTPALARSIEHRFPYLDPLNHLQVELMRRYRARVEGEPVHERVQRGIHISINGIAAGLRNTG